MYSAKYVSDNGPVFEFNMENNVIFDIDPLSEIDVDIGASQAYDQIGETVEAQSVLGITREIRGVLLGDALARKKALLQTFAPQTRGRLIFNDKYYTECYVKKTPAIQARQDNAAFSLMLYCPFSYWYYIVPQTVSLNTFTKTFTFPVLYDEHTFGERSSGGFTYVNNDGNEPAYFTIEFSSTATVNTYGIYNVTTNKHLYIEDELSAGETVTIYRDAGRIYAIKKASNTETDLINSLTPDSSFYTLIPNENILLLIAGTNENNLSATLSYNAVYTGVYDGM